MSDIVRKLRDVDAPICDEAADEIERLRQWQKEMVAIQASGGMLDGYRELGAKCAALEERAEQAERELASLHCPDDAKCRDERVQQLERERDAANRESLVLLDRIGELQRIKELCIKALCRATGESREAIEDAPLTDGSHGNSPS